MTTPANTLEDPFYYLTNFRQVLDWLRARYADVLTEQETAFVEGFVHIAPNAQALLVRLIMRKGPLYRASKLKYAEIGAAHLAVAPLLEKGWLDDQLAISLEELFEVLGKTELWQRFRHRGLASGARKGQWLEQLQAHYPEPRPFAGWWGEEGEALYALTVRGLCERLRLLFFGNLYQDWSEFVLADLGIFRYERVALDAASRSVHSATHVDQYMVLHEARQRLETQQPCEALLAQVLALPLDNPWLCGRRDKLLFRLGYQYEREGQFEQALTIYQASDFVESRARQVRVLERMGDFAPALSLAELALQAPRNAAERQRLLRMLPRLRRALGHAPVVARKASGAPRMDLCLRREGPPRSVERWVQAHLQQPDCPVFYVENTLLTALFGLLCWPAIFAPLPGAFFHPFQSAPADLYQADFHPRRQALFAQCFAELDDGRYQVTLRERYRTKFGLQSPFVHWGALDEALLEMAMACLPAAHLRYCFERMLEDLKANCTGMPDLIQFWPALGQYRMIEVKGPGDRLQDNQLRWLAFCAERALPITVCYVTWDEVGEGVTGSDASSSLELAHRLPAPV